MKKNFKLWELIFCISVFIMCTYFGLQKDAIETAGEMKSAEVVLDAGHGMPDGGAVGESGKKESEINLFVTKVVEKELLKEGINVVLTRKDENAVYTDENASIREKKRDDMHQREKIINESGAKLAVSIHMNYFGIAKYSGPQLFYPAGSGESETAAKLIKNSIMSDIGTHCNRELKAVEGGIYLLKNSRIPIVLAECGFLSNKEEEKLLCSEQYCTKMGKAIAKGIISYLNKSS